MNGTWIIRTMCIMMVLAIVVPLAMSMAQTRTPAPYVGPAATVTHEKKGPQVYNSIDDISTDLCPTKDADCLRQVREAMRSGRHTDDMFNLPNIIIADPRGHVYWNLLDDMAFQIFSNLDHQYHNGQGSGGFTRERAMTLSYRSAAFFLKNMTRHRNNFPEMIQ